MLPSVRSIRLSGIWETAPWGEVEGGDFLNCAAVVEWDGTVAAFAEACRTIELELGSEVKKQGRWRVLDIDILCAEGTVMDTPELVLPHPRLHLRRFVLMPLSEVWSGEVPGLRRTPAGLLDECTDVTAVARLTGSFPPGGGPR